jgi:hypothetical protein
MRVVVAVVVLVQQVVKELLPLVQQVVWVQVHLFLAAQFSMRVAVAVVLMEVLEVLVVMAAAVQVLHRELPHRELLTQVVVAVVAVGQVVRLLVALVVLVL